MPAAGLRGYAAERGVPDTQKGRNRWCGPSPSVMQVLYYFATSVSVIFEV
jgi:hypothetical protein